MHRRRPVPDALLRIAEQQDGVVTREQALGSGLTAPILYRLLHQGGWQPVARGGSSASGPLSAHPGPSATRRV